MLKLFFTIILLTTIIGCEIPANRKNILSPHMPVFADLNEDQNSPSNPYWIRFTGINRDPQVTLSDGHVYNPDQPTMYGTLGTHYRFKSNYYAYAMTDGVGFQKDLNFWNTGKWGFGSYIGINNSWGVQIIAAQKLGSIFNGSVILYSSLQRRAGYHKIACEQEEDIYCRDANPASNNSVYTEHEAVDFILGTELGRFKLGEKGNTTFNFKIELGYNKILNSKVIKETYPSNFKFNKDNISIGLHTGFTLW